MLLCRENCVPRNIPGAGVRIKNDFSQQAKDTIFRNNTRRTTRRHKDLRGLFTTRDVLATYSDRAWTGHNKSSSDKPATKSDRDWMEKCVGGSAPQSQCTPKTPEPTKLQPQKKKRTQFERGLQFTNSFSRRESYEEKSLPGQIPEGELMQRIKDRRSNILQHL